MNLVLIMGQSGAGKTTFAEKLVSELIDRDYPVAWLNADDIREEFDDWDFSEQGRLNAACRMRSLAEQIDKEFVIVDMICPTKLTRSEVCADFIVYMDTVESGPYEDTNKMFESPPCDLVDVCFKQHPEDEEVKCVADKITMWL